MSRQSRRTEQAVEAVEAVGLVPDRRGDGAMPRMPRCLDPCVAENKLIMFKVEDPTGKEMERPTVAFVVSHPVTRHLEIVMSRKKIL